MSNENSKRACETYAFHGQLGLETYSLSFCSLVRDLNNPHVWASNKAFAVTASEAGEFDSLMREVDSEFPSLSYRHFVVDPRTPAAFEAFLILNDYEEHATTVQMVLEWKLKLILPCPSLDFIRVTTDENWRALHELVLVDHAEGARTQGESLHITVTDGIVSNYRAKVGHCQFFIAELGGQPCAYGSATNCPNGMGMVEDLFTLPEFRQRGIASAVIAHYVDHCRSHGSDRILIGSHANEPPKHLYHALGFEPVCLTREYIMKL